MSWVLIRKEIIKKNKEKLSIKKRRKEKEKRGNHEQRKKDTTGRQYKRHTKSCKELGKRRGTRLSKNDNMRANFLYKKFRRNITKKVLVIRDFPLVTFDLLRASDPRTNGRSYRQSGQ